MAGRLLFEVVQIQNILKLVNQYDAKRAPALLSFLIYVQRYPIFVCLFMLKQSCTILEYII